MPSMKSRLHQSDTRHWMLLFSSIGITLLAAEACFRFFIVQPDSFNFTLVSKSWRHRYWKPINSRGYRDKEHSPMQLTGKKIVLAVGDSFAAGHGIEAAEQRFPDVLQSLMGREWEVINISKEGWDTSDEYAALSSYPASPDVIILSYYLNDITKAASRRGSIPPGVVSQAPFGVRSLIDRSYFFNYLYWRYYRWSRAFIGESYWNYLKNSYNRPDIWKAHQDELLKIIEFSKHKKARIIFLIFPHLRYLEESEAMTQKIETFAKAHHVETINLSGHFRGRNYKTLMVNSQDSHPNASVHREVGELLAAVLKQSPPGLR